MRNQIEQFTGRDDRFVGGDSEHTMRSLLVLEKDDDSSGYRKDERNSMHELELCGMQVWEMERMLKFGEMLRLFEDRCLSSLRKLAAGLATILVFLFVASGRFCSVVCMCFNIVEVWITRAVKL